jgi:hypothetical protein
MSVLLLAALVIFGLMNNERPEAYATRFQKLIKLKPEIIRGIK